MYFFNQIQIDTENLYHFYYLFEVQFLFIIIIVSLFNPIKNIKQIQENLLIIYVEILILLRKG